MNELGLWDVLTLVGWLTGLLGAVVFLVMWLPRNADLRSGAGWYLLAHNIAYIGLSIPGLVRIFHGDLSYFEQLRTAFVMLAGFAWVAQVPLLISERRKLRRLRDVEAVEVSEP